MKKILFLIVGAATIYSCNKKPNDPSKQVKASYPVITVSGPLFYSIPVGSTLPTITATAQDTVYGESPTVMIDQSTLDNTTPGLYQVTLTATNKYGYAGTSAVYVGVTSASPDLDLTGWYVRNSTPAMAASITKLATGLFMTSNVGGVDTVNSASAVVPAVFVVTSDTSIDFGVQQTVAGELSAKDQILSLTPGDTVISYILTDPATVFSTTAVRTFRKE